MYGGIPFEDERISYADVANMRDSLPFSQVPVLDLRDGSDLHAQSQALLRWAGGQSGLYPLQHQLEIDCATEVVSELYNAVVKVGYGSAMLRHPQTGCPMVRLTPQQRQEMSEMCGTVLFPIRFAQLEAQITRAGGDYLCGSQVTIADISFYVLASSIMRGAWAGNGVGPDSLQHCPKLLALERLIGAHPRIKNWNDQHPMEWWG